VPLAGVVWDGEVMLETAVSSPCDFLFHVAKSLFSPFRVQAIRFFHMLYYIPTTDDLPLTY
jgi:hypothetical protein